ncbi:Asp23/Gls24 family envelope stress response protein [Streptococcus thermophilus]|nr:Asp23/Gls24 family envelope stress response protein [Streptococcus thermophilus]
MSNVEKNVEEVKGELTYEDKVIQKIIGLSLENVPGLLAIDGGFFSNLTGKLINTDNVASGVNVEVGKKQVAVDLKVVVEYQKNIPKLYKKIKEIVVSEISNMTNLEVVEVNVDVVDVKTKEQHEADSVSLQDRATGLVESTSEFASDKFESAKDKVKGVAEDTKDKVKGVAEDTKDKVKGVAEDTKEIAKAKPRVH